MTEDSRSQNLGVSEPRNHSGQKTECKGRNIGMMKWWNDGRMENQRSEIRTSEPQRSEPQSPGTSENSRNIRRMEKEEYRRQKTE